MRGNKGAKTAGVDGHTAASIEAGLGVGEFLDVLRAALKDRSFRPLPSRERLSLQAFDPAADPQFWPVFAACAQHGLLTLFHTGTSVDRQRQALQPLADPGHRRSVGCSEGEAGRTARARSTNSATAGEAASFVTGATAGPAGTSAGSGSAGYSRSARSPSTVRLVASIATAGQRDSGSPRSAAALTRCSRLSRISSQTPSPNR